MNGEEFYIYSFINLNNEYDSINLSLAEKIDFFEKDLHDEEIILYLLKCNNTSKDFNTLSTVLNMEQKVNFILDFNKERDVENNLLKISYLSNYLKKNNPLHLKDLIIYLNANYEFYLGYKDYFLNILYNLDELELYILFFKNISIENVIKLFHEEKNKEKNNKLFFEYINYYIQNCLKDMNNIQKIEWFSKYIFQNNNLFKKKLNYPFYLIINIFDNRDIDYSSFHVEDFYEENSYTDENSLKLLFNKIDSFEKLYYSLKLFNYDSLCKIYINIIKKINELNNFSNDNEQIYIKKSIEYILTLFKGEYYDIILEMKIILMYFLFIKSNFDLHIFFSIFQKLNEEKIEKLNKIFQEFPPKFILNIEKYIISSISFYSSN